MKVSGNWQSGKPRGSAEPSGTGRAGNPEDPLNQAANPKSCMGLGVLEEGIRITRCLQDGC